MDVPFYEDYVLSKTHVQRLASELRVPMFEGFTMPPSTRDSETAAMYKHLRTKPPNVEPGDASVEERLRAAFEPLCQRPSELGDDAPQGRHAERWPEIAFSSNWETFARQMHMDADEGRRRLLARYEYPSVWETQEVYEHLNELVEDAELLHATPCKTGDSDTMQERSPPTACPADPDA